jgi:hypothetical protein
MLMASPPPPTCRPALELGAGPPPDPKLSQAGLIPSQLVATPHGPSIWRTATDGRWPDCKTSSKMRPALQKTSRCQRLGWRSKYPWSRKGRDRPQPVKSQQRRGASNRPAKIGPASPPISTKQITRRRLRTKATGVKLTSGPWQTFAGWFLAPQHGGRATQAYMLGQPKPFDKCCSNPDVWGPSNP